MSDLIRPSRRGFLLGLGAAAPAFIAASQLMKVKALSASVEVSEIWLISWGPTKTDFIDKDQLDKADFRWEIREIK